MKKIIILLSVGALAYSLIVYPVQLANGAKATFSWLTDGFEAVITFVRAIFA